MNWSVTQYSVHGNVLGAQSCKGRIAARKLAHSIQREAFEVKPEDQYVALFGVCEIVVWTMKPNQSGEHRIHTDLKLQCNKLARTRYEAGKKRAAELAANVVQV